MFLRRAKKLRMEGMLSILPQNIAVHSKSQSGEFTASHSFLKGCLHALDFSIDMSRGS